MTRCHYVQVRLRALLDGELTAEAQQGVRLHLETCAACRAEYRRLSETVRLVRSLPQEDAPPHFVASLQVRLRSRQNLPRKPSGWWLRPAAGFLGSPAIRWALGAGSAALLVLLVASALLSPRIGVAEIAQRAEISWASIKNFECSIVVRGTYRGRDRDFGQKLWYRQPGVYRLETQLDYPLLTLVNEERVLHYLKGGTWGGKGPLVLLRPRKPGEQQLPFPFGLAWPSSPNGGLDRLLRQLRDNRNAVLEESEHVLERNCYVVSFTAIPPGGRQEEQIRMWIDQQTFLPLRITRHRDAENHLEFTTEQVQVNNDLLPSHTFEFQPPPGATVIHGDVDPHVFGLRPRRTPEYDYAPLSTARILAQELSETVPFTPLLPQYLPEGYRLVRVNRITGHSLTAYWIHDQPGGASRVIKLVLQRASDPDPLEVERGEQVQLGDKQHRLWGRMASGDQPFPYHYVSWRDGGTLASLFAADLSRAEALRIARSVRPIPPEVGTSGEPSAATGADGGMAPATTPSELNSPPPLPLVAPPMLAQPQVVEPPMLPEMLQEADHDPDRPSR
ncbi:MAG: zf-HC2 domain-containing protein [Armatimonadetes bacterium]|nr:zf-HC2 domain-containing protein [Armatimonadota bacterium]